MVAGIVWLLAQMAMVGLVIGSTAGHLAAGQKTPDKIRSTSASGFIDVVAIHNAVKPYLIEFGIEIESIPTRGGADDAIAVAAGRTEFSTSSVIPVVNVALQQAPVKIINAFAFEDKDHRMGTIVVARKEIKDWKGLKGKIMGTHRLGSLSDIMARVLLKANGLNPGEDVTIIELPFGGMAPALKRNQVQALAYFAPDVVQIYKEDYGYELGKTPDVIPNLAQTIWIANADFLARNRELGLRMMKAILLATYDLSKMSDETYINFISDFWKADKTILRDLSKYKMLHLRYVYDPSVLKEGVATQVKLLEDFGIIKNVPQGFVDSLVDVSLMEQAYKELRAGRRLP